VQNVLLLSAPQIPTQTRTSEWDIAMNLQMPTYERLVKDIAALYDHARNTVVEAYWKIGKRIVEEEQEGETKADYGAQLIARLSEDLTTKYGRGFSERNLRNMRQFYISNKIWQETAKLSWTQHIELLPIKSTATRKKLESRIVADNLFYSQIRQAVKEITRREDGGSSDSHSSDDPVVIPTLPFIRGPLHTYTLLDKTKVPYPKGMVVVDCGFNVWRQIPRNEAPPLGKPSYTYPAMVESVIDGDTLWAVIDCGFNTFVREKLRLHHIDTPELGTPNGEKARQYVKRVLKASPHIVVRTHSYDKYARYLADVYYLPGVKAPERICASGIYLNQKLLDKDLARYV